MILTSLKSLSESVQIPPTIFPAEIVWTNFRDALTSLPFVNLYINTIIMVLAEGVTPETVGRLMAERCPSWKKRK